MKQKIEKIISNKRKMMMILCFFFGSFGVHRFYCGRFASGILYLLTRGFWGIGVVVDFIKIAIRRFKDIDGNVIR